MTDPDRQGELPPGRAYVPEARRPQGNFPNTLEGVERVWMKKPRPSGGYERGWFGPMIVEAAQRNGPRWEYKLKFHASPAGSLYNNGAWVPRDDLKTSQGTSQEKKP